MKNGPFSADFWSSDANHIALNPHRPDDADGLTEFAEVHQMKSMCFFQTSGSEGTPKWVGLPKASFLISGRAVNAHFEVTAEDRWLVALPLHHVGGFAIHARAHLSGSEVFAAQEAKWEPGALAKVCEEQGITLVSLVPAQVFDLVRDRRMAPACLRAAIIGGGGMSQALADQALELGWRVFQTYGMTEAASQIATQPYHPFGAVFDVNSLEILPHWQLGQDEEGRLIVKGEALARGYAHRATDGAWSWEAIDPTLGLRTRDIVRLWDHGTRRFLEFVGREAGYVKILGELIHLAPLQARLEELALAAGWTSMPVIVALPDERRESRLVMVTESSGAGDGDALMAKFNSVTEALCHLNGVREVAAIPRGGLGKVEMNKLQRQLGDRA
ncbi:MAG: AMP-binding protein [Prosthecobacter sp.]|nr:AMP-binding protein [Prosthecobacter sp.]